MSVDDRIQLFCPFRVRVPVYGSGEPHIQVGRLPEGHGLCRSHTVHSGRQHWRCGRRYAEPFPKKHNQLLLDKPGGRRHTDLHILSLGPSGQQSGRSSLRVGTHHVQDQWIRSE